MIKKKNIFQLKEKEKESKEEKLSWTRSLILWIPLLQVAMKIKKQHTTRKILNNIKRKKN